jgi:hypothetical protein
VNAAKTDERESCSGSLVFFAPLTARNLENELDMSRGTMNGQVGADLCRFNRTANNGNPTK